jgi:large subunit ribosomal protein L1
MSKNKNNKKTEVQKQVAASLEEAIKKVKELSLATPRKFIESIDMAINLGIDAKQTDQTVKGSILLPHGSGKKVKVVVFTGNDEQKSLALEAGAVFAGLEDLLAKIEAGFVDFDVAIATPDVMPKISKIARKLGPRGLMPSPKNGTVTNDLKKAISESLKGKVDFKNDKGATVHCLVGKVSFDEKALLENAQAILKAVRDSKPESSKGKFIKGFYLNSTMGPSVQVISESL